MLHRNNFIQGPANGKPPKLSNAAILQNSKKFFMFINTAKRTYFGIFAKKLSKKFVLDRMI